VFRFAAAVGIVALTGPTDPAHMRQDLNAFDFPLRPGDVERIEHIALV
jgi:hypothetical protein